MKVDTVPAKFRSLAEHGLDSEALKTYKGERLNRDVRTGQPILLADIAGVGQLTLEKPYFALTVPAETGMIIPGDYVKIIVTRVNAPAASGAGGRGNGAGTEGGTAALPYDATIIGKDNGLQSPAAVGGT